MDLKDKQLGLFMTRGMSLEQWNKLGSLAREIKPYNKLAIEFKKIYIFSYGLKDDKLFRSSLQENIQIIGRNKYIPSLLYSFLIPLIHNKILKNIDILKTNQMDGSWAAVLSKKIHKKFLVVRCGYEWLYTIQKKNTSSIKQSIAFIVEKFAYLNANKIILTSDASKYFVTKNFAIDDKKIKLIPNYIDTDLFKPLVLEKDGKRILFIGRLEKDKNPMNLILACAGTDLKIVFIGEGSQKDQLQELALKNKVDVVFLGKVDQIKLPEEINKSQIFVLPSYMEGNPKSLLEAMACGAACIGSNIDGIKNLIRNEENGILSDNDPKSLKCSILKVVQDNALSNRLGINAREQIKRENALEVCLENELQLYKSILL